MQDSVSMIIRFDFYLFYKRNAIVRFDIRLTITVHLISSLKKERKVNYTQRGCAIHKMPLQERERAFDSNQLVFPQFHTRVALFINKGFLIASQESWRIRTNVSLIQQS